METIKIERICKPGETNVNGITYDLISYNKALEKFKECLSCGYIGAELFLSRHTYPESINNLESIDITNCCGKIIEVTDEYIVIKPNSEELADELNSYINGDTKIYAYMRYIGHVYCSRAIIDRIVTFDIICGRKFEFIENTKENNNV